MKINIKIKDRLLVEKDVFLTASEEDVIPFNLATTAKIPAIGERINCKDIAKAVEHLGLVLLHKLYRDEISLGDIIDAVQFNVNETIAKVKSHIAGKVRPGVTKVGFGPIHAIEVFEKMTKKKNDVESLKALFIMATMEPYMTIVGLDSFVLQSEYSEVEITDDKLNDIIKASRMLECFYACISMCNEKKKSVKRDEYFSVETWVIFLRSLKNILNLEADRVEMFEDAIEHLSVLLAAHKIGISNKALVIYDDLLKSKEAEALKESHQIINRGLKNLSALPTILATNVSVDRLRFNIANVFSAFNGEVFVKNTPFVFKGGMINAYTDTNLKGHIRGSMLVAQEYVERPIQVIKKLEESGAYYSYSTDGFANMGKVVTESANSLFSLILGSVIQTVTDVKYYAIKNHYTNIDEDDMRKLLYVLNPNAVHIYVPLSVKDKSSDTLLTDELEKVKFVYKLNSSRDFLEYDGATGFKVLGSLLLKSPYIPLLKAINHSGAKEVCYKGEREKAYIKQLSYDMCLLRDVPTFSLDFKNSEINFSQTVDSVSAAFKYNSRELLRLSTAGNYHLDSVGYSNSMKKLGNIKTSVLKVCKDCYQEIYGSLDHEEKFEKERRFFLAKTNIVENPTLKDIARRIRHTVMQSLIDDTGAIREDVTMFQINELMNRALFTVFEHLVKEILGLDWSIEDEIKDNEYVKKEFLGGSYEDFIN